MYFVHAMKIELLVVTPCSICDRARDIWSGAADASQATFQVLDISEPEGERLMQLHHLKTLPAILINGRLIAIGLQNTEEARKIIADSGRHDQ